ncbi:HAD family hydrolase [Halapricum desulfuricans]|uniref:HAD superfamily hydrolase n=1 Tax=Halapricum desulfuricans TaxID=2841257 RepID=A0A897NHW9_9EURY|nr:HAD family hydrolase [Halapricum desulfuricans]QSG07473.1 HAD superfamily hydrolase [Halapricum desulfuricans]QSG10489.1 HAD superfamily hydrolase [Halapricum desulfuricans]
MERYDRLYRLYSDHDTDTLRALQNLVDLFPLVESPVALDRWQEINEELAAGKAGIDDDFSEVGETFADLATRATQEQAFTGLDLYNKYGRSVNVLILDVDETLRSTGSTDNEIPRDTLNMLTEFHDDGIPIIICTGQTLESVKGFAIQGLGSELIHSGNLSIVYETGIGVFTPGHGARTKQLLYEDLDEDVQAVFEDIRGRILSEAPENLRRGCHLQGNEFNITMKPNFDTASTAAKDVIDEALVYELDLLGDAISGLGQVDLESETVSEWTRAYYAEQDPEIRSVLESEGALPDRDATDVSSDLEDILERLDIGYYEGDAAEIGSLELSKVVGVEAALDVLDIEDPFSIVMGDSKSDLRVMRWAGENDAGIAAAPEHASQSVLEYVEATDELVFDQGRAGEILRMVYALNRFAESADS